MCREAPEAMAVVCRESCHFYYQCCCDRYFRPRRSDVSTSRYYLSKPKLIAKMLVATTTIVMMIIVIATLRQLQTVRTWQRKGCFFPLLSSNGTLDDTSGRCCSDRYVTSLFYTKDELEKDVS